MKKSKQYVDRQQFCENYKWDDVRDPAHNTSNDVHQWRHRMKANCHKTSVILS
jgi:hypothetical protein